MSFLADFKTFWAGNSALNTALPVTRLFLDYVPPQADYPYCRFTVIGHTRQDTTGAPHVELISYQLGLFNTDLDALTATVATVIGQLDNATISAATMRNRRMNGPLPACEVQNGAYTYSHLIEYEWSYYSLAG